MANEIRYNATHNLNLYVVIWSSDNSNVYNPSTSAFENPGTWNDARIQEVDIPLVETAGWYQADMPSVPNANYNISAYYRVGASASVNDTLVDSCFYNWNGTRLDGIVDRVTLVDTTTVNTDMITTDEIVNALVASNAVRVDETVLDLPQDSYYNRMIRNIKFYVDEPSSTTKYGVNDLIDLMEKATNYIVHDLQRLNRKDVSLTHTFNFETGKSIYQLPNNVGKVLSIGHESESGCKTFLTDGSFLSPYGTGVSVVANTVQFQNDEYLLNEEEVTVRYYPKYVSEIFVGKAKRAAGDDQQHITISSTTIGGKDMQPNAYSGYMLRVIPNSSSGILEEEILISEHSGTTNQDLVLVSPLGRDFGDDVEFDVEIVTSFSRLIENAIVQKVAFDIMSIEGNGVKYGTAKSRFEQARKVLYNFASNRDNTNRQGEDDNVFSRRGRVQRRRIY